MLILIKVLTWFALPIGVLSWLSLLGLVILWRTKRKGFGRALIALAILQLVAFSSPLVSDLLLADLEKRARTIAANTQGLSTRFNQNEYAAIILLGGAMKPQAPPLRPHPDLGDAADRVWHAARLYRQGIAPLVIVSGGVAPGLESKQGIQTEGQAMRRLLLDFGVPAKAIVVEEKSRTTRENAALTKEIVGKGRAALVTSAFHMPRAWRNFQRLDIKTDAFPTDFRVASSVEPLWNRLLPNANALQNSEAALKEYIANFFKY